MSGKETEEKVIVWYDTVESYNHAGQLTLETSVTINGKTVEIQLTPDDWDASKNAYIYSFKDYVTALAKKACEDEGTSWSGLTDAGKKEALAKAFCNKFGITSKTENHPTVDDINYWIDNLTLKVEDKGENNLTRTMSASIPASLNVAKTQFHETTEGFISYGVTVGPITATAVTYPPEEGTYDATVKKYMIGTSEVDGVEYTTVYPFVDVKFTINVLTGDDAIDLDEFEDLVAYGHMQIKESDGIIDKILAPGADGKSYLENRLGLIGDMGNSYVGGTLAGTGGEYTFLLPLYNEDKIQIEYALSILDEEDEQDDDKKIYIDVDKDGDVDNDDKDRYYYRVEYNNTFAPGHGTDLDRTYQGGRVILVRTGEIGFKFHKLWQDDGKPETVANRPDATYELWRYPLRTNAETGVTGNYASSANVLIPNVQAGSDEVAFVTHMSIPKDSNEVTIEIPKYLDKYDGEGYPYVYFIRETIPADQGYQKFYGKLDKDGNVIAGTDKLSKPYADDASRDSADTGVYYDGTITNRKTDMTQQSVTKTWDSTLDPTDVSFPLLQINQEGKSTAWPDVFTLETENYLNGTHDSGWHKGYVDLPKFDENGNLYTYLAREESIDVILSVSHYGKDVNGEGEPTDREIEAQSVEVHNAPIGRTSINLRKIWLDDSAGTDRTDVRMKVVATVEYTDDDGQTVTDDLVLYGENGMYGDLVVVTKATDWIESIDVTLYRVNGQYVTELPVDDNNEPTVEPEEMRVVRYTVTEISLGANGEELVDTVNTTPAGYPTVGYGHTSYVVFYNGDNGISPNGTTRMDEDEYYTVTNLRYGTTQMGIRKIWEDDGTVARADYEAKIQVNCDTADRLKSEASLGYAKVHPALYATGWVPVNGGTSVETKTHVDLIQALPTGQEEDLDPADTAHTSYIYYYDLPLYDETGKILQYTVNELPGKTDANGGYYKMESSNLVCCCEIR